MSRPYVTPPQAAPDGPTFPELRSIYRRLLTRFGPQHWWPGDTPLEICVGAILTQNTAWTNVEKAIANLRRADLLDIQRLAATPDAELAEHIRPSGYFNLKARRLKGLVGFLLNHSGGDLPALFAEPLATLRPRLLQVYGVGPETADSILLYAGGKATFVVDAYTIRIFTRLGMAPEGVAYHAMQAIFMSRMPPDVKLFNEYHALLVALGKDFCRPRRPRCGACPLEDICVAAGATAHEER
ncbi:MAG: endonuclease III domain-containing protein [Nitrospirota bacterium]|nr:endonuclease III domain-containing protein [Nitrospirota bacterium]